MTLDGTLEVTVDTAVQFRFTVTATEPVELQFTSGKIADVTVSERSGRDVWRWGSNRMFTQALQSRTVTPDSPLEQQFSWADATPGEYVAVAELAADQSVEAEASFEVPE